MGDQLMDRVTSRRFDGAIPALQTLIGRPFHMAAHGEKHYLALVDGEVWAWGWNETGRLGCRRTRSSSTSDTDITAQRVAGFSAGTKVVYISAGSDFSAAVTAEGQLYTWGCGDDGKLGHGSYCHGFSAQLVWSLAGRHIVRQVSCGKSHMLILTAKGLVFSTGECSHGRLGLGEGYAL